MGDTLRNGGARGSGAGKGLNIDLMDSHVNKENI